MHPFDAAMRLETSATGRFSGRTTVAYANMIGPFGGITSALMLHAVMRHPDRAGAPVALTVNYAAAVADGEFEIHASPCRTNRSTQHWNVRLQQGADVQVTATAVLAQRRQSWSATESSSLPNELQRPEDLPRLSMPGLPAWVDRYDLRFLEGGPENVPHPGHSGSVTRLWVRDDPPRPATFESIASMADCFFPRVFLRLGRMLPAGTVSMTTYFHAEAAVLQAQADRYLYGVARGLEFRNGFFDQVAEIWSDDAQLLARSHQLVYYKA